MDSRQAYVALNMIQGIGPVRVRSLVAALGSPEAIFAADRSTLMGVQGVGADTVNRILEQRSQLDPAKEEVRAAEAGARVVTPLDAEYPKRLLQIHDPPLALYVQGTLQSRDEHGVAVVGSRRTSHYGLDVAERLAFQLAQSGVTVVSGLARGIDTAAHRGALRGQGRTLAVLGGGIDCLFPPDNAELARQMSRQGAVMTEYPFGRQPDKTTFPVRNRIVSGISLGVVVVEADLSSGAMITAHQAAEQGRTVFAVPGRIDALGSRGPHQLIKNGARLVQGVEDILQELETFLPRGAVRPAGESHDGEQGPRFSKDEAAVLALIEPEGEVDVDSLIRQSGFKAAEVGALLLGLEMKRAVKMLPGQRVGLRRQQGK